MNWHIGWAIFSYVVTFIAGVWIGVAEGYKQGKDDTEERLFRKYELDERKEG